jgi:alpha-L-fucosidase
MKTALLVMIALAMLASVAFAGEAAPANPQGKKYEANWASIDARPTPPWFSEAKFGIFIHWGVYSVPAWGPKGKYAEWYWHDLNEKGGPTEQFHNRVYGKDFDYKEFAPMFRAEMFEPHQWADVFARSGAKYIVLTSKHHEGFCLWPNAEADKAWGRPWNSVAVGAKRDLLGDLSTAVRARGLKMGFYYSLYEWYHPWYTTDFAKFRDEHFFPQFKDVVTRYKPSIIFADGEWEHSSADWKSAELLAWLFNESGCGDDLVINDRWGKDSRSQHGGYFTTEYGQVGDGVQLAAGRPWEECRGIGASFGYNRNEDYDDYHTTPQLLRLLVELVGKGGNLLLDIGPTADGRIPVIMQDRLIEMGKWLKVNGDAIYGTSAGPWKKPPFEGGCTVKGNTLYVHVFKWPAGKLELPGLKGEVLGVEMLDKGLGTIKHEVRRDGGTQVLALERPARWDPSVTVVAVRMKDAPAVDTPPAK